MNKRRIHGYGWHRCIDVLPKSMRLRHWTFGFRQYSFNHIAQVLQSHNLHVFCCSPLYRHALVSSPFQVQVSCSPRSHCSELRPTLLAILSVRDTAHALTAHSSHSKVELLLSGSNERHSPFFACHFAQLQTSSLPPSPQNGFRSRYLELIPLG